MDLSKLSDEELLKLAGGAQAEPVSPLAHLSDEELLKMAGGEVPSQMESGLRGAAQGATFGFADEATAAAEAALSDKTYDEALAETRALYKKAEQANPKTYVGGELTGGVATSFIPGLNVAKAGSLASAVGKSALSSALYGAGGSEGDKLDRVKEALTGAGVGGVMGGAGYGLVKGMQKVAPKLAIKATGATGREQQFKLKPGTGEALLEKGIIKPFDTTASIAKRSESMLDEASENIGKSLKSLDKVSEISKDQVLATMIAEKAKLDPVAEKAAISKLDKIVQGIAKEDRSTYSFSDLWDRKKKFDKKVNWMSWAQNPDKTQADYVASKAIRESVEGPANVLAPELAEKFSAERKMFGLLKPINEASERRSATMNARMVGGLLDMGAAGIGGALGSEHGGKEGAVGGALGGLAFSHGIAPRAASTLARAAYSPIVQATVQKGVSGGIPYATQSTWRKLLEEKK